MTGIERIGWPTAPRIASRAAAKSGFFVPSEPSGAEQPAAAAGPLAATGAMLTLQELQGETQADREARRHGQDMLAALAQLQRALLGAEDDGAALQRLEDLLAAVPLATDRRLATLVSAIVLRIRVELARRQRSMSAC